MLKQALELYDFYTQQVASCNVEIERMYALTRPDWEAGAVKPLPAKKRSSHSKTCTEPVEVMRQNRKKKPALTCTPWHRPPGQVCARCKCRLRSYPASTMSLSLVTPLRTNKKDSSSRVFIFYHSAFILNGAYPSHTQTPECPTHRCSTYRWQA